ncbi:DUF1573 domain-containing protein [Myroides sp. LJL110]
MKVLKKIILLVGIFASLLVGCSKSELKQTQLEVIDNNRHYYPIEQGRELELVFTIKNLGDTAFRLKDLIVSCGCIIPSKSNIQTIPAGREGKLTLSYDSTKNIGYVKHIVSIYGNLQDQEFVDVVFDLNVVPDAHYTKDYEQYYQQRLESSMKHAVDGPAHRSYYLDQ